MRKWHNRRKGCHAEGHGQALEVDPQESHEVQQDQV